jgi:membrane-associated phospholipid phosphatase
MTIQEFVSTVKSRGYYIYYLFLIIGFFILILTQKGDFLIWLNTHHNKAMNLFFKYWTHLGDGLVFAFLGILFLLTSYYRTLLLIVAVISQTIVIQGLKRFVFGGVVRPKLYFENFDSFYQVPGVEIHSANSFPSGHTATAFTVAVLFSLMIRKWSVTGILMVMAILVGLSRVYLLQHFFIDIYFGSMIGFLIGFFVYFWIGSSRLNNRNLLKRGLIKK